MYKGEFKHGLKSGYGILTTSEGGRFEGYWREGSKDGFGIETLPFE